MICQASAADFLCPIENETLVRIFALWQVYGEVPFIRYYTDKSGGLAAVMDGVGYFSPSAESPCEEWELFLAMNPAVDKICCPGGVGEALAQSGIWSCHIAPVLKYAGERPSAQSKVVRQPSLPAVFALLTRCFDQLPPLEAWYPDVSHRVRHGGCMLACIEDKGAVISTAMTVAQAGEHAILGQVATDVDYRCHGYAATCIRDLISRWQGKHLYIIPAHENAEKLYQNLGFAPYATRAELTRVAK